VLVSLFAGLLSGASALVHNLDFTALGYAAIRVFLDSRVFFYFVRSTVDCLRALAWF
jgi:hypothetical protein